MRVQHKKHYQPVTYILIINSRSKIIHTNCHVKYVTLSNQPTNIDIIMKTVFYQMILVIWNLNYNSSN